jgi:hypothetical protein
MKMTKTAVLLAIGFIAVLLFAGCFSPVGVDQSKEEVSQTSNEPFLMDITYGIYDEPVESKAKAAVPTGPNATQIKSGLYNYIQLVVVNNDTGEILAFENRRRSNSSESEAKIQLDQLPPGDVSFLLLMGYWDRTVGDGGFYVYNNDVTAPVLLASGHQVRDIKENEGGKVTITMWPIVTYADFMSVKPPSIPLNFNNEKNIALLPGVEWDVYWRIIRQENGVERDGLAPLLWAQEAIKSNTAEELKIVEKKSVVDKELMDMEGPAVISTTATTQNTQITTIGFTGPANEVYHIGNPHSVNFQVTYVPFGITDSAKWRPYNNQVLVNVSSEPPKWIIMNGLNLEPKDLNTEYDHTKIGLGKNGNGSVLATVIAVPGYPEGPGGDDKGTEPGPSPAGTENFPGGVTDDLILYNGKFEPPNENAGTEVMISFMSLGYPDTVHISYAIVNAKEGFGIDADKDGYIDPGKALPYARFTNTFVADGDSPKEYRAGQHTEIVNIPSDNPNYAKNWQDESWQVWLVFTYNGKVSNRLMIPINGWLIVPEWGE